MAAVNATIVERVGFRLGERIDLLRLGFCICGFGLYGFGRFLPSLHPADAAGQKGEGLALAQEHPEHLGRLLVDNLERFHALG